MIEPEQAVAEILIVEDEAAHAEGMEEGLSRMGHHCTIAGDGVTGIARLHSKHFDIIVTDLMLGPGPDGLAVLDEAVKHSPGTKVILVTAHSLFLMPLSAW